MARLVCSHSERRRAPRKLREAAGNGRVSELAGACDLALDEVSFDDPRYRSRLPSQGRSTSYVMKGTRPLWALHAAESLALPFAYCTNVPTVSGQQTHLESGCGAWEYRVHYTNKRTREHYRIGITPRASSAATL